MLLQSKTKYPLPNPSMIFDKLAGCTYFSKLDLRWAYFQVRVAEEDIPKTTFRSPLGSFSSKVMSMGLTNAAPTFQRLMDSIFGDLDYVSCYLDDVLIASRTAEEHLQHVAAVLERLQQHQLLARETKCAFFMTEIKFLGFVFSAHGKAVDSSKTEALRFSPAPDTVLELQCWLGAVNYYSSFIPHFADITAPLTDLLKAIPDKVSRKSKAKLNWLLVHQNSFEAIRAALASPPLLRLFDPVLPCKVSVDASKVAVGGVLEQEEHGVWRPVAFYSRKLSPAEQRYTTRERECLAVKQCLVLWRHYLLGALFVVKSDHESLKWLRTQDVATLSDRLLLWVEFFSLFDFDQGYIPGELSVLPDHLSRPISTVSLSSDQDDSRSLDLIELALLLQEHQHIFPVIQADAEAVFPDTQVRSLFYDQIVAAQQQDPETKAIVKKLLDPATAGSCEFRMLYVVQDGVLGVRDAEGHLRTVIPVGPLRAQVCRFFHDEAGHPGVQRTLQAVTRYFYWSNMSRFITRFVTSCSACQASKGSNRRMSQRRSGRLILWTCLGQLMATTVCWCGRSKFQNWLYWCPCQIRQLRLRRWKWLKLLLSMFFAGLECHLRFFLTVVLSFDRLFGTKSGCFLVPLLSTALHILHTAMGMWSGKIELSMKCSDLCFTLNFQIFCHAGMSMSS